MPSIFDVAKQAGVSASTVSRAFNAPHLITEETRNRVFEAAERVNYRRTRLPEKTATPKTPASEALPLTLGFHFFAERPEDRLQRNSFYSQVLAGALAEASEVDARLVLSTSDRHDPAPPLPPILAGDAAGFLLVGDPNPEVAAAIASRCGAVVFIDAHDPARLHDEVLSDNFGGAFAATNYLIKQGHRRIAFVTGHDTVSSFEERINGYVCAHFRADLPVDRRRIFPKDQDAIRECLQFKDRPTAIMGANDDCALVVLHVCQQMGLQVPRDLSVVGFDDLDFASRVLPALTSVHVPAGTLGRLGMRQLYSRLRDGSSRALARTPICSRLSVSLVERDSCAPPPIGL